jgi:alpha-glucosidase
VLENHDIVRLPTRYGSAGRARAAALLLLALPGAVFLYAGQELGLEEIDLADELRQDPIFFRTQGGRKGRDGARIPMPWEAFGPGFGFTTGAPWLPIPETWAMSSVAAQREDTSSFLALYRAAIERRPEGVFGWRETAPGTLAFQRDDVVCLINFDAAPLEVPDGELLLASEPDIDRVLPPDTAAWIREERR